MSGTPDNTRLTVEPRWVRRVLLTVVAVLTLLHLLALLSIHVLGYDHLFGLVPLFRLGGEANVPAWFSSLLLVCGACLAATVAGARDPRVTGSRWRIAAGVLLVLAVDEAAQLHERVGAALERVVDVGGLLAYAWVLPGGAVALAIVGLGWSLARELPDRARRLVLAGGALFLGSAVLLELGEAALLSADDVVRAIPSTLQEVGEMVGVVLVLDGLVLYLAQTGTSVVTDFRDSRPSAVPRGGVEEKYAHLVD